MSNLLSDNLRKAPW